MKQCSSCRESKPVGEFYRAARNKDGLQCYCKGCITARNSAWRLANPEKSRAHVNECAAKNREKRREAGRARYANNLDELRKRARESAARRKPKIAAYVRNRRASDPVVALRGRLSGQLRYCLSTGKGGKTTEALLGYTIEELRAHLERQFLKGMSWENMGAWHVDHIVPLASFTITDSSDPELRRAWALPNLRPLWADDNVRKGAKRVSLL